MYILTDKLWFPPVERALPDGLLAFGGDLSVARLTLAYQHGIFPWFSEGEPILWWTPSPRTVLFPEKLHISRSLRKALRQQNFQVTINHCFSEVIEACAEPRTKSSNSDEGTWITDSMKEAYINLHQHGHAHSFEIWCKKQLVGGLYGIAIGQIFFGESMFSRMTNASKIAFVYMVQQLKKWEYRLIDCQIHSDHLCSLGAEEIEKLKFEAIVKASVSKPPLLPNWGLTDITGIVSL